MVQEQVTSWIFRPSTQSSLSFLGLRMEGEMFWFWKKTRKIRGSRCLLFKCKNQNFIIHGYTHILIPIAFRPADANELTIVATLEDSIDFAHIYLTKDELRLGREIHETRKYTSKLQAMVCSCTLNPPKKIGLRKSFTSGAGVPVFHVSFLIICVPQEEMTIEGIGHAEIGMFVLWLRCKLRN